MKTFGDYREKCNAPYSPTMHRCGVCDSSFSSKKLLDKHHVGMKEIKFTLHPPVRTAGSIYLVDAQGYRVTSAGRRY
jgi:hypothetical protein